MNKLARAKVVNPKRLISGGRRPSGWTALVVAIALLLAAPILVVIGSIFIPAGEVWSHLASTVLPRYITNSLQLMLGVGAGTLVLGVGTAWLVTMCRFPGQRFLEWSLLLPMAIPAYILAYTYTDFLQFAGPLQTLLRDSFGWSRQDYWFPAIRSLGGAIYLLTLALYPYVYLLARTAFLEQSATMLEAGQCLRCNPWQSFLRISLPLARPAIVAGVALVLMETLSDFGTVDYFGIQTFTTGIYRTWFGLGERLAASQLAAWLLMFVLVLLVLERSSRANWRHPTRSRNRQSPFRYNLTGLRALAATTASSLPIVLGFVLPGILLLTMTLRNATSAFNPQLWRFAQNSLLLAGVSAGLAVVIALLLGYGARIRPRRLTRIATQIASVGYAVPGSVIAVSVLIGLGWLDARIDTFSRAWLGVSTGLLLSGTMIGLVYAYLSRFLTAAFSTVESGLKNITLSMDDAAKSLGKSASESLWRVHIPLLRGSLLTAALLVFVDVIKELPATLIVRPFNLDTLAVRVYRLASDERLAEASGGALTIVLVGILPVILLSNAITRSRQR